jgi:endonuclease/exonuclease/phosphatase family metal-dependent hydrolase
MTADAEPRLRVMTYNIRHGRGTDGRVDLERIADVIAAEDPDVVALQEVDVLRTRSGSVDQAELLAQRLGMTPSFAPCISSGTEHYGIATLTRIPLTATRQIRLPPTTVSRAWRSEPRSALATRVAWADRTVEILNTHLSLSGGERRVQTAALVRDIAAIPDDVVVCGDFNCTPRSAPYRTLCGPLLDAGARGPSWPSALPIVRLDHLMYRGDLDVRTAAIVRTRDARRASDHLPLVASFRPAQDIPP